MKNKYFQTLATGTRAFGLSASILFAQAVLAPDASAQLTIVRNFTGGAAPANLTGTGNLQDIFNAAADYWERTLCMPAHTVTISFRWGALSPGVLGSHTLLSQGGVPNREISGSITFDNDGSSFFFADGTPGTDNEYNTFMETEDDLGGGTITVGRIHRNATGAAANRIDLLSVARHEIGHALGLSSANSSFQAEAGFDQDVDVTAPRPAPGSVIPTDPFGSAHVNLNRALMSPSILTGVRLSPSDADVLSNAEISEFTQVLLGIPLAASSVARNGTGANPTGYVETAAAVIGQNWQTTVDLSNGAASSIVLLGFGGAASSSTGFGELLIAAPIQTASVAAGVHTSAIPFDCSLVGATVSTQAATLGPPPIQLHNAIDVTAGAF